MPPHSERHILNDLMNKRWSIGEDLRERFSPVPSEYPRIASNESTLPTYQRGGRLKRLQLKMPVTRVLLIILGIALVVFDVGCFLRPSDSLSSSDRGTSSLMDKGRFAGQDFQIPDNIIHVVNTKYVSFHTIPTFSKCPTNVWCRNRFQQNQPHLVTLGRARLELFKAFCLPTMIRQTNQDFLWLIQTDPDLDKELMDEMKSLLAPHPNFYLIKSKRVKQVPIARDWHRRSRNITDVVTGDIPRLQKAHDEAAQKILIETNLDADDGLAFHVVQDIRNDSIRRLALLAKNVLSKRKTGWVVSCYHQYVGWYPENGMAGSATLQDGTGLLKIDKRLDTFCPTPGLTIASVPSANLTGVPILKHHTLVKEVPRCTSDIDVQCLNGIGQIPLSVRARTPSSAGMYNIGMKLHDDQSNQFLWTYLNNLFGITRKDVQRAGKYFLDNSKAIARENLEGLW
jgi:hypothetical protein